MTESVTVRVPATTANLGPGFDCLGLSLDLWDEVTLAMGDAAASGRSVAAASQAGAVSHQSEDHQYQELVRLASERFFAETGCPAQELEIACRRRIPLGRGLGSSAAAIVAGCVGANALAGTPLDWEELGRLEH